jgi:hypothetical protein
MRNGTADILVLSNWEPGSETGPLSFRLNWLNREIRKAVPEFG